MSPKNCTKTLSTPRLILRATKPSDAEQLAPLMSDAETMAFWSSLPHTTFAQTQNWVDSMMANKENGVTDFVIVERGSDAVLGKIGAWNGEEIGFLLARSHWRKGIVSEAMQALLPELFGQAALEKLTADVDPRNSASLKLLKNFGFKEVGRRENTYQIGEEWVNSIDLVLTKDDWQSTHRKPVNPSASGG